MKWNFLLINLWIVIGSITGSGLVWAQPLIQIPISRQAVTIDGKIDAG